MPLRSMTLVPPETKLVAQEEGVHHQRALPRDMECQSSGKRAAASRDVSSAKTGNVTAAAARAGWTRVSLEVRLPRPPKKPLK